jgi:hypothetical protein
MRCDEVIRELAVPTDDRDVAALSEHLTICGSCARWAKNAGQLDRLWEATRPTEPSPEIWHAVWAQVAYSLDSPTRREFETVSVPMTSLNGSTARLASPGIPQKALARSRPWNWTAIGLIGFAQAAAVLVVVGLTWQHSTRSAQPAIAQVTMPPSFSPAPATPKHLSEPLPVAVVEIEEGRQVVIYVEGSTATVVDRTPQSAAYRLKRGLRNLESPLVDDWLLMLNEAESMTKPLVAMKE